MILLRVCPYSLYTASKTARGRAAFEKPAISRFVVDARAERERLPRLFLAGTLANSGSDRGPKQEDPLATSP